MADRAQDSDKSTARFGQERGTPRSPWRTPAVDRAGPRPSHHTAGRAPVAGNKGSPDLARDVRGFAVSFLIREGNWDLVGNNIPIFFIQDAIRSPDLFHAVKPAPDRGFPQAQTAHDNFWDFISLSRRGRCGTSSFRLRRLAYNTPAATGTLQVRA